MASYPEIFGADFVRSVAQSDAFGKYTAVVGHAKMVEAPIYLMIDEYDNFTNTLIRSSGRDPYREITHGTGFYRLWFKRLKGDRKHTTERCEIL